MFFDLDDLGDVLLRCKPFKWLVSLKDDFNKGLTQTVMCIEGVGYSISADGIFRAHNVELRNGIYDKSTFKRDGTRIWGIPQWALDEHFDNDDGSGIPINLQTDLTFFKPTFRGGEIARIKEYDLYVSKKTLDLAVGNKVESALLYLDKRRLVIKNDIGSASLITESHRRALFQWG